MTAEEIAAATAELLDHGWKLDCAHHDMWRSPQDAAYLGPAKALAAMKNGTDGGSE